MRLPALILLTCLSLPVFAEDPKPSDSDQQTMASLTEQSPFQVRNPQLIPAPPRVQRFSFDQPEKDNRCYTMHTFTVRQPDKASDAVNTTGERTCTSASKFKVKPAAPKLR